MEEFCWKPVVWAFWDGFAGGFLLIAVSAALLSYPLTLANYLAALGFALGTLMILLAAARAGANTYYLTGSHVRRVYRLIVVQVEEAPLEKVMDVVVRQGILGRILGFGDVRCDTAGTPFPGILFKGVRNPEKVAEAIRERIKSA